MSRLLEKVKRERYIYKCDTCRHEFEVNGVILDERCPKCHRRTGVYMVGRKEYVDKNRRREGYD